ncbi:hypothetical protein TNCV_813541 [Trichonephila clavipes]|nr:hypothetical protein TNCV_813541 [Trichonephila clavipes]
MNDLRIAVDEAWQRLPQATINGLIYGIPHRIEACTAAEGTGTVTIYPLGAWGRRPGDWCSERPRRARISWAQQKFLAINFDPPVSRVFVDLLRPGPEMNLNRH